jgi:hypothetical protein
MDQVNSKSSDSAPSVPVGERISADAPPPSSMNDLEALDIVKVFSLMPQILLSVFSCLPMIRF